MISPGSSLAREDQANAMDTLERASQLFFQALNEQQAGRLTQAETLYREALVLAPDRTSVMINLAAVLIGQNRFTEALRYCERVIKLDPTQEDAVKNAAVCRRLLAGEEESRTLMDQAINSPARDFESLNNRGVALRHDGRIAEAVVCFDQALLMRPEAVGVRFNRGSALVLLSRAREALADFVAVLRASGDFLIAQQSFFELLRHHPELVAVMDDAAQALAIRATVEPWGRPQTLAPLLIALLRKAAPMAALLARFETPAAASPAALDRSDIALLADSALLGALLQNCLIPDAALERLLTALRSALLQQATTSSTPDDAVLALHCALARQCHLNDYLYPASDEETRAAAVLRVRLAHSLRDGSEQAPAAWVVACGSYAPLHIGLDGRRLAAQDWPEPVAALLRQQIEDPELEESLAAGIGRLTPIADRTSQRVRQQYEASPFPRWVALPTRREALPLPVYLANRIPGLGAKDSPRVDRVMVLNAGCGTGQHAIETAQGIAGSEVLAIDLSLTSLAYAKRMAMQMGLRNLRFAQADLLALDRSGLKFDLIESTGVLHHLAEPLRGLAILVERLRPGGVMRLGLYSARGRAAVIAARGLIVERGFAADSPGIRASRRDILALPPGAPERAVVAFNDFYSTNECRDLLFHEQEHRLDLRAIGEALKQHSLTLLGFELDRARRTAFTTMFPEPAARRDTRAWEQFETRHPDAFANMYHLWVRRAD
jgi:SAM-dependent methyltransferase/tetratricopeptide (TPR) repeat protein